MLVMMSLVMMMVMMMMMLVMMMVMMMMMLVMMRSRTSRRLRKQATSCLSVTPRGTIRSQRLTPQGNVKRG